MSKSLTNPNNIYSPSFAITGLISILAFLVPVSSVNYPSVLYYSSIALVFMGVFALLIRTQSRPLSKFENIMMLTWILYPAVTAIDMWFRVGWIWVEFQEPSRFLLILPIFLMVRRYGFSESTIRWGVFSGAVIAGIYAIYLKHILGQPRVFGGTSALVAAFGNISLILGFMSVALFQPLWHQQKRWGLVALIALAFGVFGSLASGTKGGWISLPLLCWIGVDLLEHPTYFKRFIVQISLIFMAILAWIFVPSIQARVSDVIPGIYEYFNDGLIAEGSVGVRLALWHAATLIFIDNPWFGTGPGSFGVNKAILIDAGLIPASVSGSAGPHSQFFNSLFESGILGPFLVYSIYASFIWYCHSHLSENKALAITGIIMSVGFISFGLVEVIWDINNAGVFFTVMMALIASKLSFDNSEMQPLASLTN
jgi:O-antigen ligase